ncbi:DUF3991 and TOPRIM domain-containing protein [Anaerorhabdus sp.]|uniref:DUF3991 and TOPRIM domain-containing protein n=1 Tax=Anaerorhabdus sp. TaxID=1872524 RepID=UPI002FC99A3B
MAEYRKFSDEQKALANSINLVDYLRNQGETLIKSGREFRWQRYTSVTIKENHWYKHKSQEGGYPVKFLEEFYGMKYVDAMELLLSYASDTGITANYESKEEEPKKEFALPERSETMKRMYAYLLKTRHIDKDVINEFVKKGLLYEDKQYHNVVFVGKDNEGIARHAHKKSTYESKDGTSYRGNVESSDPRYSFHHKGTSSILLVFEAPIDMLSYISIYKDNWQQHSYLALCGLGMQPIEEMLEDNPNINLVISGADHDIPGIEGSERIEDYIETLSNVEFARAEPLYKDFNEDRKAQLGLPAVKGEDNTNIEFMQDAINELKCSLTNDDYTQIEHKQLSKAFADMYYGLNHDGINDYPKIKEDFMKITKSALNLANYHLLLDRTYPTRFMGADELMDHYRSYKDRGSFAKRIERVKGNFQEVKKLMDASASKIEIGKAYEKLAMESATVMKYCNHEMQQQIVQEVVVSNKKPQAPIVGADGNIFNLMGIASNTLKEAGLVKEADEMFHKITQSGSYDEALNIMMEYIEPISTDEQSFMFDMSMG